MLPIKREATSNSTTYDNLPKFNPEAIPPTTSQEEESTETTESGEPRIKKHKKGPAPKLLGTERCSVCNEKASGFHYGVLSCEGCKGFFRRSENREKLNYRCKGDKNCDLKDNNPAVKRKCQYCRYWKCVELGMKNHIQQSQIINELRRQMQEKPEIEQNQFVLTTGQIDSISHRTSSSTATTPTSQQNTSKDSSKASKFNIPLPPRIKPLEPKNIHKLQFREDPQRLLSQVVPSLNDQSTIDKFADQFMKSLYPEEIDLAHCTSWSNGTTEQDRQDRAKHFADLAMISAQIFINQCMMIPAFSRLAVCDQILLTKQGLLEVFYLRLSLQYNTSDDTIIFINGGRYSKSCFIEVGHSEEYVNAMYKWCRELYTLLVDSQVSSLMFVIIVFNSNRESLTEGGKAIIDETRDKYLHYLQVHCKRLYSKSQPFLFVHLLTKLRSMSDLLMMNSDQIQVSGSAEVKNAMQPFQGKLFVESQHPKTEVTSKDFMHLTSPCSYKEGSTNTKKTSL